MKIMLMLVSLIVALVILTGVPAYCLSDVEFENGKSEKFKFYDGREPLTIKEKKEPFYKTHSGKKDTTCSVKHCLIDEEKTKK